MIPSDFHPVVRQWWNQRFRVETDEVPRVLPPTDAQLEGWSAIRRGNHTLIAAPTGSGKTLAAFLTSIDQLFREGLEKGGLPDEVRVIYVSPLKALSADIHKNLAEPRREIRQIAEELGYPPVKITAAVRSGDTPASARAAMLKLPPHILVTTPESLYLLLTAERSREMLRTARVVIVDEIHAVLESRRGAHLALSLERLSHIATGPIQRIGLSATQKPIETVGEFLVGGDRGSRIADRGTTDQGTKLEDRGTARGVSASATSAIRDPRSAILVDRGHKRQIDLAIEIPGSPLEAVMAGEVWQEIYNRLVQLIEAHRTTLIFVNTRRLAERMAFNLSERLGAEQVAAHHGSLAKEVRLDAEERLRNGTLRVMVATASLELGIDIGHVDLVCQVSSPHRIATLLQRVGRSGHTVGGLPKGRIFPLTRDDLLECTAMVRGVKDGELDRVIIPEKPLDVLAQQIVAESAAEEWDEDALFAMMKGAYPYRNLTRTEFDETVEMLARGYTTRRGRRAALVHHDAVNHKVRARKGSRLMALQSGGAIPEVFDYRVILEPDGITIGTLNEDFAIESMAGDVFQLGNASWRILKVGQGVVRVADAQGQPPSMPFWLGEAPARSDEVSAAISTMKAGADALLPGPDNARSDGELEPAIEWLMREYDLSRPAAEQIALYLGEGKRSLGVVPTIDQLVVERFFDEAGGMQLIVHSPLGSRVNKAWGLALRKKFCQSFNFELQAAATEEGIVLSLGPSHSFPLIDVFRYLHPNTVRETLIQAVLDSPIFETRWRWTGTLSLAVPRNRNGQRIPAQVQRMYAEDLLAAVFPDAAACFENIEGARSVPDHPLVDQSIRDCLEEAMDLPLLIHYLKKIVAGEIKLDARDTPEPSVFCHEIVNSAVYTFLDDAPLEERRTRAVQTRRATETRNADDLGALDQAAIDRVREEAWPMASTADELHDALLLAGFFRENEVADSGWFPLFDALVASGRGCWLQGSRIADRGSRGGSGITDHGSRFMVPTERVHEFHALVPQERLPLMPISMQQSWTPEDAAREMVRGRMEVLGPVTVSKLSRDLGLSDTTLMEGGTLALESEGRILRGQFTAIRDPRSAIPASRLAIPDPRSAIRDPRSAIRDPVEWCDRRLLARIHRYTLNRLRAEIEPVTAADFMRFLLHWQHLASDQKVNGPEGVAAVIEQLDGCEVPAAAWELDVLPARCADYSPQYLDGLCLSGRVTWGRRSPMNGAGKVPLRRSPIALMLRDRAALWSAAEENDPAVLSSYARDVLDALKRRGASFFHELVTASRLLRTQVERALAELAGAGLVTADSFGGLRALLSPAKHSRRGQARMYGVDTAGRWALLGGGGGGGVDGGERTEAVARG
ncbi:MAG: DEAD/DEAH box helicase, partial [Gemmatimonadota bacterium]